MLPPLPMEQQGSEKNDPRPDLEEDSDFWKVALSIANFDDWSVTDAKNCDLYERLRDFRLAGCRLSLNKERRSMAFSFGTEVDEAKKQSIKQSAQKHKDRIKDLFKRVYKGIAKAGKNDTNSREG